MAGIRFAMDKGLTDKLRIAFPNITPVERPLVLDQVIPNSRWVSGFTSAEGCFIIYILSGKYFGLKLTVTRHSREEQLISTIADFSVAGRNINARLLRRWK